MKRQLLQAFLHLIPYGMEVHPNKIKNTLLEIEPDIETKKFNSWEVRRIREKFKDLIIKKEEYCNIINIICEGDLNE